MTDQQGPVCAHAPDERAGDPSVRVQRAGGRLWAGVAAGAVLCAAPALAQPSPLATAARVAEPDRPRVDGVLDEAVWAQAEPVTTFTQLDPDFGAPVSEPLEVRFLTDGETLFIGVQAFDSAPDQLRANRVQRDADLFSDDSVIVILDPSNTRRDGYFFQVNPRGARRDAIVQNNSTQIDTWDTLWRARSQITDSGWSAELAIPFRSLTFDADAAEWGLQIARTIARKNERARWTTIDRARPVQDIAAVGRLAGLQGVEHGRGFDAQVYGAARFTRDWERPRDDDVTFEPSANLYQRITPQLTGALTLNTDFSDTPLDARRVNTTRFDLFFPETRDFFLQDAAVFEFGGGNFSDVNGTPFFSRRIGIVGDQLVDLDAGLKLSGRVQSVGLGALVVRTGPGEGLEEKTLGTFRASAPVFRESKIGGVVTYGDPASTDDVTVAGADFQHRISNLFGQGDTLLADFFYTRSVSDVETREGDSFGVSVDLPNDVWLLRGAYKQLDATFDAPLGFVIRPGTRRYDADVIRRFRPEAFALRTFDIGSINNVVTDLEDVVESREQTLYVRAEFQSGDGVWLTYYEEEQDIRTPFLLPGGVLVRPRRYTTAGGELYITSSPVRSWNVISSTVVESFLDGNRFVSSNELFWRPSPYLTLGGVYSYQNIDQATGEVDIHLASLDAAVNFTPDMQLLTELQYDNISENMQLFSRFRWEPRPATEIFVAIGHSATVAERDFPRDFRSQTSSFVLRVGNTFRY